MIKRYEIKRKENGEYKDLLLGDQTFFTRAGAEKQKRYMNLIGHALKTQDIVIVWDRKLSKQVSTELY